MPFILSTRAICCKPIAADETALLEQTYAGAKLKKSGPAAAGLVTGKSKTGEFIEAIKQAASGNIK